MLRLPRRARSPIRYNGGKSKHLEILCRFLPDDWSEYREPFGGGCSMGLWLRRHHPDRRFWFNDIDPHLVQFWTVLRDQVGSLQSLLFDLLDRFGPASDDLYAWMQDNLLSESAVPAAAGYLVKTKIVMGGNAPGWGCSGPTRGRGGLSQRGIRHLLGFSQLLEGVELTCLDYAELMQPADGVLAFLDPPYEEAGRQLYQHGVVDLDEMAKVVNSSGLDCLITLDDSEANRQRFVWAPHVIDWHPYWDHSRSAGAELIITTYTDELIPLLAADLAR